MKTPQNKIKKTRINSFVQQSDDTKKSAYTNDINCFLVLTKSCKTIKYRINHDEKM